jgi:hypothetical protein
VIATKFKVDYTAKFEAFAIEYNCSRGVNVSVLVGACPLTGNVTAQCDIPWWSNESVVTRSVTCESAVQPTCDYWDAASSSWSGEGCVVKAFTAWNTTCECTHLTSFASKVTAVGGAAMAVLGSAGNLFDPNELMKNLTVVLTFGILFLLFCFGLCWGRHKDRVEQREIKVEAQVAVMKHAAEREKLQTLRRMVGVQTELDRAKTALSPLGDGGALAGGNLPGQSTLPWVRGGGDHHPDSHEHQEASELADLEELVQNYHAEAALDSKPRPPENLNKVHYNGIMRSLAPLVQGTTTMVDWVPASYRAQSCFSQFLAAVRDKHKYFSVIFLSDRCVVQCNCVGLTNHSPQPNVDTLLTPFHTPF